ncbi:MAG TPA: glycoside hydrolase family 20 zincin-like fold domain-containing protein, partial [Bacteroidota bacterium]
MNRLLRLTGLLFAAFLMLLNSRAPAFAGETQSVLSLVPNPANVEQLPGKFLIDAGTSIAVDGHAPLLKDVGKFLASRLRESTGYLLPLDTAAVPEGPLKRIYLSLAPGGSAPGGEGYELAVTGNGIRITAKGAAGAFYALQTLFQLLPPEFEYAAPVYGVAWDVPCVRVQDAPRFSWRGMHLDVGRHFFGKKFVEEYIDLISRYKFNVFHWHL